MQDIKAQLDEIQRLQAERSRHADRFNGMFPSAYANPTQIAMRLLEQEHQEIRRLDNLIDQKFKQMKEKQPMKRTVLMLVFSLVLLVFVSSFAVAQDNPLATNTPQVIEGTATLVSSEPILTAVPSPVATESPTETPRNADDGLTASESILVLAMVILAVLLSIFAAALVVLAGKLLNAAPPWVKDILIGGAGRATQELKDRAALTPNTFDDELAAFIETQVRRIIQEANKQPAAVTAPGTKSLVDPLAGEWKDQYTVDGNP